MVFLRQGFQKLSSGRHTNSQTDKQSHRHDRNYTTRRFAGDHIFCSMINPLKISRRFISNFFEKLYRETNQQQTKAKQCHNLFGSSTQPLVRLTDTAPLHVFEDAVSLPIIGCCYCCSSWPLGYSILPGSWYVTRHISTDAITTAVPSLDVCVCRHESVSDARSQLTKR